MSKSEIDMQIDRQTAQAWSVDLLKLEDALEWKRTWKN